MSGRVFEPQSRCALLLKTLRNDPQYRFDEPAAYSGTRPGDTNVTQKKTSYDWTYDYQAQQPHAASLIGERAFSYDANGNQTGWDHTQNGTRRTITWDEDGRTDPA